MTKTQAAAFLNSFKKLEYNAQRDCWAIKTNQYKYFNEIHPPNIFIKTHKNNKCYFFIRYYYKSYRIRKNTNLYNPDSIAELLQYYPRKQKNNANTVIIVPSTVQTIVSKECTVPKPRTIKVPVNKVKGKYK